MAAFHTHLLKGDAAMDLGLAGIGIIRSYHGKGQIAAFKRKKQMEGHIKAASLSLILYIPETGNMFMRKFESNWYLCLYLTPDTHIKELRHRVNHILEIVVI